jgi:hypothetical protein
MSSLSLKIIKSGLLVVEMVVPDVSRLIRMDIADQNATGLQHLIGKLELVIENMTEWMDKISVNEGKAIGELAEQMKRRHWKAPKYPSWASFWGTKMKNLYRSITDEGHIKRGLH